MKNASLLIGPALMIFIGLQLFSSVVITFILFYGWLLFIPILKYAFPKIKPTRQAVILGAGSGLLFFLFIFGGLNGLHVYLMDLNKLRVLLLEWGIEGTVEWLLVVVLLLINPILEEIYWRGFMFDRLRDKMKAGGTIFFTAFFYTLYHMLSVIPIFYGIASLAAIIPVFIAGLFFGYLREKTGSILAAIISHALSDLGIVAVYWFIIR
ncbi:CPBP family intramembrane glutamic endopeptidase [Jeotgalibacillus proteolyticus]|uniref:CPBP family intramembrane metalloprotease n=1 Tax=Jeotgalibacillus proteolyticus TaxID=2082395 RepID=A0A2S5GE60_9BACL|nr:type II CAAX endopeptidase family protein [Jeotgalibacillus proteolyticus]PPA71173.1 CPBP family intramembrane metalloprotease [Jeotgalibacillus proteolyticus]